MLYNHIHWKLYSSPTTQSIAAIIHLQYLSWLMPQSPWLLNSHRPHREDEISIVLPLPVVPYTSMSVAIAIVAKVMVNYLIVPIGRLRYCSYVVTVKFPDLASLGGLPMVVTPGWQEVHNWGGVKTCPCVWGEVGCVCEGVSLCVSVQFCVKNSS